MGKKRAVSGTKQKEFNGECQAVMTRLTFAALIFLPLAAQAQYFGDSSQGYASTVEEGTQRCYADVVRSYGMSTLLSAQAINQIEQARKVFIENQMRATQTYFDRRRYRY